MPAAASAGKASARNVAPPVAPYTPPPIDRLPPVMAGMVSAVAGAVGCDPASALLPALALIGAAVGASLVVEPQDGWREPPLIWGVTVGDSGTGKSPAADPFTAVAEAIEQELEAEYAVACSRHAEELAAREALPDDRPKPLAPVRERFLADDCTIERLVENLKDSPRGMAFWVDELAEWFGGFTRYKSGGASDAARWLKLYDGRRVGFQRRTGEPREVAVARGLVGVNGTIQPDILKAELAKPGYVASGLAARLNFCFPPKRCPRRSGRGVPPEVSGPFRRAVLALRKPPFDLRTDPGRVGLDGEADSLFTEFHDGLMERAEGLDGGPMAAVLPKLGRQALRLALIHFAVGEAAAGRDPGRGCIRADSMRAGIALAEWFAAEAERVYDLLTERPEDADLKRLAQLVARKGGRLTPRQLQQANGRRYPKAETAELALETLAMAGWGRWETVTPAAGGSAFQELVLTPECPFRPQ